MIIRLRCLLLALLLGTSCTARGARVLRQGLQTTSEVAPGGYGSTSGASSGSGGPAGGSGGGPGSSGDSGSSAGLPAEPAGQLASTAGGSDPQLSGTQTSGALLPQQVPGYPAGQHQAPTPQLVPAPALGPPAVSPSPPIALPWGQKMLTGAALAAAVLGVQQSPLPAGGPPPSSPLPLPPSPPASPLPPPPSQPASPGGGLPQSPPGGPGSGPPAAPPGSPGSVTPPGGPASPDPPLPVPTTPPSPGGTEVMRQLEVRFAPCMQPVLNFRCLGGRDWAGCHPSTWAATTGPSCCCLPRPRRGARLLTTESWRDVGLPGTACDVNLCAAAHAATLIAPLQKTYGTG